MSHAVVVMGISGCGKSTVGAALAARLGWDFVDGDDHHPAANVAKMAEGTALDDTDREPWLDTLNQVLRERPPDGGVVLASSALKADYRRRLARGVDDLTFVYLVVGRDEAERRLTGRGGHFMKEPMVAGQLATLEEPPPIAPGSDGGADGPEGPAAERADAALHVDATLSVDQIVTSVVDHLPQTPKLRHSGPDSDP